MSDPDTPLTESVQRPSTNSQTRLRGPWLWVARLFWIGVACLTTANLIITSPDSFHYLSEICSRPPCLLNVDTAGLAQLEQAGLSVGFFATYIAVLLVIVAASFGLIGALIFWRRSTDWMALYISLALITFGGTVGVAPQLFEVDRPALGFMTLLIAAVGTDSLLIFPLLFPDGRFVPRWSRWLVVAVVLWSLLFLGVLGLHANSIWVFETGNGLIGLTGFFAQVYRYRRVASLTERQQSKWLAIGLAASVVSTIFLVPLELGNSSSFGLLHPWDIMIGIALSMLAGVTVALAIMIAMIPNRLWDVDFVINRSLVYGGVTLLLSVILIGGFAGLRILLATVLGQGQEVVAAVIPAVFAALIFNPTRTWLRRLVDARIYGIRIDYRKADMPAPSPVASSHALQTQVGGYQGLELIGRGGMGEVYRGADPRLNRPIAVKVLPAHLTDEDTRKRFLREAQATARLKHPNIVTMYEVGESDGMPYMVMEYVDGQTLGEVLKQRGRLPLDETRSILTDIAAALDYAHAEGIIHRDIKPSNVMIEKVSATGGRSSQRAVLTDFGIAKLASAATRLTRSGMIGTLDYMSPEQIQDATEVDGRADVYALGVMVYQMLAGETPFRKGSPGALVMAHLTQPPPDPRDAVPALPESAALAIMRAMSKQPAERFNTSGDFAAALA